MRSIRQMVSCASLDVTSVKIEEAEERKRGYMNGKDFSRYSFPDFRDSDFYRGLSSEPQAGEK